MTSVTIRQRILASFGVVLLLMAAMAGTAYLQLNRIENDSLDLNADALPGLVAVAELRFALNRDFFHTMEFLLETDKAAAAEKATKLKAERAEVAHLSQEYEKTIFTDQDRKNFDAFKALLTPYYKEQDDVTTLHTNGKTEAAVATMHARMEPAFEGLRSAMQTVTEDNEHRALEVGKRIVEEGRSAKTELIASILLVLVLSAASGFYLLRAVTQPLGTLLDVVEAIRGGDFTRDVQLKNNDEFSVLAQGFDRMTANLTTLVGEVQKSGIQVNTSVTEIAATYKEQQATTTEIAATTAEIGATSKEISATSRELVKTMDQVSTVAEQTGTLAGTGQAGLSRMTETMHHLIDATGAISGKLAVLNEKAANINQVVTTITKVADQTNLLSLNAAIEAEKAGEYGKGFAVVATEIRRLADQTAVATYDIEQIVKEIQSAVSAGVMGMDKFSEDVRHGMQDVQQVSGQLSQIIQQVQVLVPRFESVNESMQAQATGADQITDALMQLSDAVQQTVESLRQSTQTVDEMNQVSGRLRTAVSGFRLRV